MKKILLLLVTITACVMTLAAEEYDLWINEVQVTSENANTLNTISGVTGTVKYNPSTKVLTLNKATLNYSLSNGTCIRSKINGLTIVLIGSNSLTAQTGIKARAIDVVNTTIEGPGSLSAEGKLAGIQIIGGSNLTINNVPNLSVSGSKYGIYATSPSNSQLVIKSIITTVHARGSSGAIRNYDNFDLRDGLQIIEPIGGYFNNANLYDASGNFATQATISLPSGRLLGDLDGNNMIDVEDVNAAINIILKLATVSDYPGNGDMDDNGMIDVEDVNKLINIILKIDIPDQNNPEIFEVNGVKFKMVNVKGGTFIMGATAEQENDAYNNEHPTHIVTLSSYKIAETEVTQELWLTVMGENPSYNSSNNGFIDNLQRPVECVSWEDCQSFIIKLNQMTGKQFRLPTEAEWEFAARGGRNNTGYKYAGSDDGAEVAWYSSNSGLETHQVGTKTPNELGLYDMSGNVSEWCQDWFDSYYYTVQTDPVGPPSGYGRVLRGGGYALSLRGCRVTYRENFLPTNKGLFYGLRLAM